MSTRNHLPNTVEANLGARLAPFNGIPATPLEDLDAEVSRAVAPRPERLLRLRLIDDLKLLFAALGAGGRVVPLGDNSNTAKLLSQYAASLAEH